MPTIGRHEPLLSLARMANGVAAATAAHPVAFRNWRRLTETFFIMREGFTPIRAWPAMHLSVYLCTGVCLCSKFKVQSSRFKVSRLGRSARLRSISGYFLLLSSLRLGLFAPLR